MLSVSCRCHVSDQFWKRGNVRSSSATVIGDWFSDTVGSMNGGRMIKSLGIPSSQW